MNYRLVCRILAVILAVFTTSMAVTIPFALWFSEYAELVAILESMGIGFVIALILFLVGRGTEGQRLLRRESLAVVGLSWLLVAAFGAIPFRIGGLAETYTDAYFEAMSGLTTTGSTILTDIEGQARSLLLWRSFLHFVGGLGIVVFFVAILPVLGVGGKSLFKQEVPGPVPEGLTPRIKDTALLLCKVYIGFNIAELLALLACGLSFYDAINHAFATMATGGFSTKNSSIAAYTAAVEWVIIIFMFFAGTNFSLHLQMVQTGDIRCYFRSSEFRYYLGMAAGLAIVFSSILWFTNSSAVSHDGFPLRDGIFTTLTIITTTGFGTVDFDQWPEVSRVIIVMLMFFGGMAGSTAGGMKIIRLMILVRSAFHILRQEVAPRRVMTLKIDGRPLDPRVQHETFAFFFVYISIFAVSSVIAAALMPGQDLVTSVTAVIACLNNIGPGLAAVGPTMNFAEQSDALKWLLALLMALGRLELYAILVLLSPRFWMPD